MKEREKNVLKYILIKESVTLEELVAKFKISRRSLYYDIAKINSELALRGKIVKGEKGFSYIGTRDDIFEDEGRRFLEKQMREKLLLYLILKGEFTNINEISERLQISRNTVVSDINNIKANLAKNGFRLTFSQKYRITGNERKIRSMFILGDQYPFSSKLDVSCEVREFNKENNLQLSDYSQNSLTHLVEFSKNRIASGSVIRRFQFPELADKFDGTEKLIGCDTRGELAFISSYIMTLANARISEEERVGVDEEVAILIKSFEDLTCKNIENKEEFIKNLRRHLLASYHRKKFEFPIYNPLLEDIKSKYENFFAIIKSIIKNNNFKFASPRDEEIAYIVAYFGGYIYSSQNRKINIVLVCPNGLVISNTLRMQLERCISNISIIEVMSLQEFEESDFKYDYVISTVKLDVENCILVSPLLTEKDISRINSKFMLHKGITSDIYIEDIIGIIEKSCKIQNVKNLRSDLYKFFNKKNTKKEDNLMLKDVITMEKIHRIKSVASYQEAIEIASAPLIEDGSITHEYVEAIFEAIEKFGPYVVLADRFALPHASSKAGVSRVGMSMLVVEETVDFLGKDVNIFCVLAAVDDESHIHALGELATLLYEEENIEKIISGSREEIYALLTKGEKQ